MSLSNQNMEITSKSAPSSKLRGRSINDVTQKSQVSDPFLPNFLVTPVTKLTPLRSKSVTSFTNDLDEKTWSRRCSTKLRNKKIVYQSVNFFLSKKSTYVNRHQLCLLLIKNVLMFVGHHKICSLLK